MRSLLPRLPSTIRSLRSPGLALALAPVLLAVAPTSTASAQAPKVGGDYYEDSVDLGFAIKRPKDWELIPPKPSDVNLIAKFSPPTNKSISLGRGQEMALDVYLLRFDKKPKKSDEEKKEEKSSDHSEIVFVGEENVGDWIKNRVGSAYGKLWMVKDDAWETLRGIKGIDAREAVFDGTSDYPSNAPDEDRQPVKLYVAEFPLNEQTTVAMVGFGPGDKRKWRTYESAYSRMAKSMHRIDIVDVTAEARSAPDAKTPRGKKRIELLESVAKSGKWKLYETENYFVLSAIDDKPFLDELMERLEAIHSIYEKDYPPEKARRITDSGDDDTAGTKPESKDGDDDSASKPKEEETSAGIDPLEVARTSVVRVCRNASEYSEYGGPGGSAGYWSPSAKELVIYDDKASGGRNDTWITLNHEAFHQYIYYFYGELAPHSWYNEGTGDFYSGFQMKHGKFSLKENPWRVRTVQQAIREDEIVPLQEFVRWTQQQYYGSNDRGTGPGICYAEGWSLIYFLRTGAAHARGWNKDWDKILDSYLETLASTKDLDKSIDVAFAGVDWQELEDCWKTYTLKL